MRKSIFTRFFAAKYAMAGLLLFGGMVASFAMKATLAAEVAEELKATAITPDPAASAEKHLQSLKTIDVTFEAPIIDPNEKIEREVKTQSFEGLTKFPFFVMGYEPEIINGVLTSNCSDWYQFFVIDGLSGLEEGQTYKVTAMIRASKEHTINVQFGNWGNIAEAKMKVGTEWKECSVEFQCPPTATGFTIFQPGDYDGTIEIQWVRVSKLETPTMEVEQEVKYQTYTDGPFPYYPMGCEPPVVDGCIHFVPTGDWSQFFCLPGGENPLTPGEYAVYVEIKSSKAGSVKLTVQNGWGGDAENFTGNVALKEGWTTSSFRMNLEQGGNYDMILKPETFDATLDLKSITIKKVVHYNVNGESSVTFKKLGDTEIYEDVNLSYKENVLTITLANEVSEYGMYVLSIPQGTVATAGGQINESMDLIYHIGAFEPVSVLPAMDERVESLKEVTIFMTDRVGGVLDGAKLNVYKDGDMEAAYTTATIDILNTNSNEATITLDEAITEYGTYTIEVPAGVIFDKFYNGEDAAMSGAASNEAFELTYKVGFFEPVSVLPAMDERVESLNEVTVFMTDRVGGVLDGAKLNVYKDGDTEVAYTTATIDILNSNSNEVTITLADEITEYGKYQIVVPAGVIFDKYYNGEDAIMSGATGNDEFVLDYQVGIFSFVSTLPATTQSVKSLNEVTVFMSDRVGGVLDGAKINVYKDGDKTAAYRTATLEILNTNANEVTLILNKEITANGQYTFEIPANVIFDKYYTGEDAIMTGAQGNPAIEFTYTVDTTVGISGVTTEGADEAIYNIGGVRMQKAGNGLYIINGKKVVIRKK